MWSKLVYTELGSYAKQKYSANDLCYHNWPHVLDLYAYLEKEGVPYSQPLDLAILFHDIIYDEQGNNELRSADFMKVHCIYMFPLEVIAEAHRLIMLTCGHEIVQLKTSDDLWIIKADLAGFLNVGTTIINFGKFFEEARDLYRNKTDSEIMTATYVFLTSFYNTMEENYNNTLDKYFLEINRGISVSIELTTYVR